VSGWEDVPSPGGGWEDVSSSGGGRENGTGTAAVPSKPWTGRVIDALGLDPEEYAKKELAKRAAWNEARAKSGNSVMGQLARDAANMALEGSTFGFADKAVAGARSLIGGSSYDEELKQAREATKNSIAGAPGTMGTSIPLAAGLVTGTRLPVLGRGVTGLLGTGAAYGVLDDIGHRDTGDAQDRILGATGGAAKGAGTAALVGASLPVAKLLGAFTRDTIAPKVHRLWTEAGLTGPNAAARLQELGPQAIAAEATPQAMGLSQGAAIIPTPGLNALTDTLNTRSGGANARIRQGVDNALGPVPVVPRSADPRSSVTSPAPLDAPTGTALLTDEIRYVAGGLPQMVAAAPPVNASVIQPIVAQLDRRIANAKGPTRVALTQARDMLVVQPGQPGQPATPGRYVTDPVTQKKTYAPGTPATSATPPVYETNFEALHNAKSRLSDLAQYGDAAIGVSINPRQNGVYKYFANEISRPLKQHGPYSDAMDAISGLKRQQEAIELGTRALSGQTPGTVVRPYEMQRAASGVANRTPIVGDPLRVGVRDAFETKLASMSNDLTALRGQIKNPTDFSNQNLRQVYGQTPIDDVTKLLGQESTFQRTGQRLLEGSQTGQRLASKQRIVDETTAPDLFALTRNGLINKALNFVSKGRQERAATAIGNDINRANSLQGANRDAYIRELIDQAARAQNMQEIRRRLIPGLLN